MNNEAEHPGKLDSLRMREGSQAHSLSKHVDKLERILDVVAPRLNTQRSHQRTKALALRHQPKMMPLQPTNNA